MYLFLNLFIKKKCHISDKICQVAKCAQVLTELILEVS